jgi:AcrR family transcriptional regulator
MASGKIAVEKEKTLEPSDFLLVHPKQARAKITFQSMIAAGKVVLAEGGLSAVTTDSVAQRAGVNISTFYKYFTNRDDFLGYLAMEFIQSQARAHREVIAGLSPDAPMRRVVPRLVSIMFEDWSREPAYKELQGIFLTNPMLYQEYSRASVDVADALQHFRQPWGFSGTDAEWYMMHAVFGDCAIGLLDRAAKSPPDEQVVLLGELQRLAVAYFSSWMQP